jgi:hypothetical protein
MTVECRLQAYQISWYNTVLAMKLGTVCVFRPDRSQQNVQCDLTESTEIRIVLCM